MRILITGANRGIGRALFDACRARGDAVTGTTRHDAGAGFLTLDVTDPASIRAMAEAFGAAPLDLLVCNAGVYLDRGEHLADGYPASIWAESFAANVTGVFLTVQALLPNLRAAQGKIAIISSVMGSQARAPGGSYVYRASKAAAVNLGRNLAADLALDGIAVGIYHPGWVQTEMGGTDADIDVATSVDGLLNRFDALGVATTGCYEDYAGRPIPL
ncbi:SDR family NAD(P)-dependent oxidoreductase [Defluviimonas sp. WL0024]|uniref:SDR family NAD(P)-dependent oxidoreductase n=1 Tax=Albidovulum salinarum TaxID=2984153 RepID=A0ABT2WZU3_9RHOB|nr:SDR family NAD(P)-dependent oxidoreductase [Defluviimonas sp. WL0024]MCU9847199.1 SDR family NAD(P)-dependent oxidoreductase [Defluviimonas sp. WL0024]